MKNIFIASDHAGYNLKKYIISKLSKKMKISDLGPRSNRSVDYPDFAKKLSKKVTSSKTGFGILVCGSGMGMAITANKTKKTNAKSTLVNAVSNWPECFRKTKGLCKRCQTEQNVYEASTHVNTFTNRSNNQ